VIPTRVLELAAGALVIAAVLVVAGGATLWLARQPAFAIRAVEVRGDLQHVTAPAVRNALKGRVGGTYFTAPLEQVRRAAESMPWVAQATVRRVWPDRLRITLREHRALGVWNDGRLLSDDGRLFVANPAEAEISGPLPEFSGPPAAAPEAARRYYEFAARLASLGMKVEEVAVSERASWSLTASSEVAPTLRIELGRDGAPASVTEQLDTLVAFYPAVVARLGGPPARLDARHSNGFAAALNSGTQR
jgi:cell division protein FtsQ